MPELPNRDRIDRQLTGLVSVELTRQQERMLALLGDPPDARRVPESYWRQLEAAVAALLFRDLERVYLVAAQGQARSLKHTLDEPAIANDAVQWVTAHASALTRDFVERTKQLASEKIEAYYKGLRSPERMNAAQADDARVAGTVALFTTLDAPRPNIQSFRQDFGSIFSKNRAAGIAITANTQVGVAAERNVATRLGQDTGVWYEPYWHTRRDGAVCKICGPRHGTPIGPGDLWPGDAHPRCRCWVVWRLRFSGSPARSRA